MFVLNLHTFHYRIRYIRSKHFELPITLQRLISLSGPTAALDFSGIPVAKIVEYTIRAKLGSNANREPLSSSRAVKLLKTFS